MTPRLLRRITKSNEHIRKNCAKYSRIPSKAKTWIIFSRGKKSKPLIRIASIHALLGNCGYSKNCGNIGGVKVKELRRFRKSEIRTHGGWSDVIKLVTSRCVFNGPYCALFLKRSEYRSRWFSYSRWIIARIFRFTDHKKRDRNISVISSRLEKESLARCFRVSCSY